MFCYDKDINVFLQDVRFLMIMSGEVDIKFSE